MVLMKKNCGGEKRESMGKSVIILARNGVCFDGEFLYVIFVECCEEFCR